MQADIVRASTLGRLQEKVNVLCQGGSGWRVEGAPFRDPSATPELGWCWAVVNEDRPVAPGGVRLLEPDKRRVKSA